MIYKFKSKASGDVIMLGPLGDQVLRLLGREPTQKGIIEAHEMTSAVALLKASIQAAEQAGASPATGGGPDSDEAVSLRRRLWPMIEMLTQSGAMGQAVVWGV